MPCEMRERRRFKIWKVNKQEQKASGGGGFGFQKQVEDEARDMFARLTRKRDEHIKALEDLKRKLEQATSEEEKTRLRKEIRELEKEIQGFENTMEELVEFMKDMERRTINLPSKNAD